MRRLLRIRLHDPESGILPGCDALESPRDCTEIHEAVIIVEPDVAVAATPRQHGPHSELRFHRRVELVKTAMYRTVYA